MKALLFLVLANIAFNSVDAGVTLVTPKTNQELSKALCSKFNKNGYCIDGEPRLIILKQIFDFTGSNGKTTVEGCHHLSTKECLAAGQQKLNEFDQCKGLQKTKVTYDKVGRSPLHVGSNKYIVSLGGGLKGIGLKICNNHDVLIYGMSITDINAHVIWGGDAITLDKAENIWIHKNYISRIGRQMIVTGHGSCQNILISNNEFDGRTKNSAYCDGYHYWLWLFAGSDDTITLYSNKVHHTSGRGAHVTGIKNSKVLLHMISNMFEDIRHEGLIDVGDQNGRVLIEGNTFTDVSYVIRKNLGKIYYPSNNQYASICKSYLGRNCLLNRESKSSGLKVKNDVNVLNEFKSYGTFNTKTIKDFDQYFNSYKYKYQDVDKYVNYIINTFKSAKPRSH